MVQSFVLVCASFIHICHESIFLLETLNYIIGSFHKVRFKLSSTPLDTVLNIIWEISKSAHWYLFLCRIRRVIVALCLVRDDSLEISLGAQGSRL
jgi:hypothetical protein